MAPNQNQKMLRHFGRSVKERKGAKSKKQRRLPSSAVRIQYSLLVEPADMDPDEHTVHTHLDQSSLPKPDIFRHKSASMQQALHSRTRAHSNHMQFELSDT